MEQNELEVYEYNGYSITKDGTVRNQNGKVMSVSDGQISLTIHGKNVEGLLVALCGLQLMEEN